MNNKIWNKIFKANNPYQSFKDYVKAEFTCPKCKKRWFKNSIFDDFTLNMVSRGILVEKSVGCPCGFREIIWQR